MRKQETRKRKKAKRVRKSRRQKQRRSHTKRQRHRRSSHRHKQQGGNYAEDFTGKSIDGMPYTKEAVVVAGQDIMKVRDLKRHAEYLDFQGLRT
jgi:hypothetical protein